MRRLLNHPQRRRAEGREEKKPKALEWCRVREIDRGDPVVQLYLPDPSLPEESWKTVGLHFHGLSETDKNHLVNLAIVALDRIEREEFEARQKEAKKSSKKKEEKKAGPTE